MAVFIPVPNVGQFNQCFTLYGQQVQNVYHLRNDSPFDQVSLALACEVIKTWWNAEIKGSVHSGLVFTRIIARALDTDGSPAIEYTNGLPLAGTYASEGMPGNVTVAVKWGTAFAGRSYRGRTFHLGITTEEVTNNTLDTGVQAAMIGRYSALLDALDSTPYELVVVSRFANNAPRATGVATPITSVSVDNNIDSQRRRLAGRGA